MLLAIFLELDPETPIKVDVLKEKLTPKASLIPNSYYLKRKKCIFQKVCIEICYFIVYNYCICKVIRLQLIISTFAVRSQLLINGSAPLVIFYLVIFSLITYC